LSLVSSIHTLNLTCGPARGLRIGCKIISALGQSLDLDTWIAGHRLRDCEEMDKSRAAWNKKNAVVKYLAAKAHGGRGPLGAGRGVKPKCQGHGVLERGVSCRPGVEKT
jgi:hypothetical protein